MTGATGGNSEVTTFRNTSFGLLASSDVQLDAWSRLCFRPQVMGVRKFTCSGEHFRKSSQSLYPLTENYYTGRRNCTLLSRRSNQNRRHGWGMWHVWGWIEMHVGFWWENLKEIRHLEDLEVSGRIILKWIINKYDGMTFIGYIWLRIETMDGFCWHGNEPLGFIKRREFLDWLRNR